MLAVDNFENKFTFGKKLILISEAPTYTVVDNPNINITCNQFNNFENSNYPSCPISGGEIPKRMLVALTKISDMENWTPGSVLNTQCFDARYLYNYWAGLDDDIINPNDRAFVDKKAAEYVKKLVEGNPKLTEEEEEDYYEVKSKNNSPVKVMFPKINSPIKTATFNLENVYSYSEQYMDDWLATFGLKYDTLAKKRYMTISKLMEHNLFDNQDTLLIRRNMNNFLTLLNHYPISVAGLKKHL